MARRLEALRNQISSFIDFHIYVDFMCKNIYELELDSWAELVTLSRLLMQIIISLKYLCKCLWIGANNLLNDRNIGWRFLAACIAKQDIEKIKREGNPLAAQPGAHLCKRRKCRFAERNEGTNAKTCGSVFQYIPNQFVYSRRVETVCDLFLARYTWLSRSSLYLKHILSYEWIRLRDTTKIQKCCIQLNRKLILESVCQD